MEMLFSQEEVWEMAKKEIARDAVKNRDSLYDELQKYLVPLGRISDLLAAFSDKAKLTSLAHEFGLEI